MVDRKKEAVIKEKRKDTARKGLCLCWREKGCLCVCVCFGVCACIHVCVCLRACVCVCVYVRACVCIHLCLHMYSRRSHMAGIVLVFAQYGQGRVN